MTRLRLRALPVRPILFCLLLLGTSPMLAGCATSPDFALTLAIGTDPAARQKLIDEGGFNYKDFLGYYALYVSDQEIRELVTDEESFLRYLVGPYLVANPHLTYERFADVHGSLVSAEEFAAYRYQAFVWIEGLKARPENRVLAERMELFEKRANWPLENLTQEKVFALIKDDKAFEKFLTDDDYAQRWLEGHDGYEPQYNPAHPSLGPAYTGVTPGTGS